MSIMDEWTSDDGSVRLLLGKAEEILPTLGKVDACVTDPPFGVLDEDWDDMTERELARFTMGWLSDVAGLTGTAVLFFGERTRRIVVPLLEMLFPKVRQIIWNKRGGHIAEDRMFYAFESAWLCKSIDTWEVCEPKTMAVAEIIRRAREAKGLSKGGVDMVIRGKKTGLCYRWEEAACLPTPEQAEKLKPLLGLNGELDTALGEAYAARDVVLRSASEQAKLLAAGMCDVLTYSSPAQKQHPCEKPVELMQDLISTLTREGGTIVDPFCGSGSTLVAAARLGRSAIGIEQDPAHFATAKRRIAAELSRTPLFDAPAKLTQRTILD